MGEYLKGRKAVEGNNLNVLTSSAIALWKHPHISAQKCASEVHAFLWS